MVVRRLSAAWLAAAALCVAPAVPAADSGDIVVVSAKGEVHITMDGVVRAVPAGGLLVPPATLRTGRDGSVELRQGATTISVGPETTLDFPALEKRGAPIDRVVQPLGNAFYDVGKRAGRKLKVETPYLVAVIKGTQFNVVAQADGATISLFEGLLEIRSPDDSAVVDLKAGEIASRKRGDKSISIMRMEGGKPAPAAPRPQGGGTDQGTGSPSPATPKVEPAIEGESLLAGFDLGSEPDRSGVAVAAGADLRGSSSATAGANLGDTLEVAANAAVNPGDSVDLGLNASVSAGAAAVTVDAGAAVDLGGASIDVNAAAAVDAGQLDVAVGVDAAVDAGAGSIDAGAGATLGAGSLVADVGAEAAVDLGGGAIDAAATVAVDAGPLNVDVGLDAAVDAGAGNLDVAADTTIDAGPVAADVGAAVDVGAGTVDLGLGIAGVDLGLGLDLGLDDTDVGAPDAGDTEPETETTDTVVDVGGLLDGLLRRPGRR